MIPIRFLGRFINASTVVGSDPQIRLGYNFQIGFTYAPTIVKWNGVYHLFCCSADYSGVGWDQIRHATSTDGISWSEPRIALFTSDKVDERSCCDPSLARFKDRWYLFYSGNAKDVQTAMFVARAEHIDGPYLKFTKRGTWEQNPGDPKIILGPINPVLDGVKYYGAGQQTVVAKDGKLLSWHSDDTSDYPTGPRTIVRFSTSEDGIHWSAPVTTKNTTDNSDLTVGSFDVKYDPARNSFVLFDITDDHQESTHLTRRFSNDGVSWSQPEVLCGPFAFPNHAHNVGVSGDENGYLLAEGVIVGYGAPHTDVVDQIFTIQDMSWGHWDMCGHFLGGSFVGPIGYFANSNSTWFSDGLTYGGFLTAGHFQMHRHGRAAPSLGERPRSDFGTCIGLCPIPAGYLAYGTATHYSRGDGSYVSFASASAFEQHKQQHPDALSFGWLESDPNAFMSWGGIWQE
jgi:hypothetical protein